MTSPEISGGVMYKKTARAVGNEEGEDAQAKKIAIKH